METRRTRTNERWEDGSFGTALPRPRSYCTTINDDFLVTERNTSSSNGTHPITLFSGCCLASGASDCCARSLALSLRLASRSPANLKITEPEERFLMAADLSISPGNSSTRSHSESFPWANARDPPSATLLRSTRDPPTREYVLCLMVSGLERRYFPSEPRWRPQITNILRVVLNCGSDLQQEVSSSQSSLRSGL